ncbi:MAG: hypothetical protein AB7I79_12275 [Rhizobiaceae bacterium]
MGILEKVASALFGRAEPIADRAALAAFMNARAAFLAQKCIVEFCRVRAGVYWQKLFAEAEFQRELDRSRWRAYPATYGMMAEMVDAALREAAGVRRVRLGSALETIAAETFRSYPVPDGEAPDFWEKALVPVRETLAEAQGRAARPVREMPKPLARSVFKVLPIHETIVTNDYDYIFNFLRMNLLRAHDDFLAQARPREIANDLLGPA